MAIPMTSTLPGFEKVEPRAISRRIIMGLDGLGKIGKTTFALSAPGPIAYIDLDCRAEGVIEEMSKAKGIYQARVVIPTTVSKHSTARSGNLNVVQGVDVDECEKQWEKYVQVYKAALMDRVIRSIVVDTSSEAYELIRLARFGRLAQVEAYHYGPVKKEFRDLVKLAYQYDKNVIFVHKLKPKYIGDKRTNEYERDGLSDMNYQVQLNARLDFDDEEEAYSLTIEDCGLKGELRGEVLSGVMCSFPFLASMVFDETSPDEWE